MLKQPSTEFGLQDVLSEGVPDSLEQSNEDLYTASSCYISKAL